MIDISYENLLTEEWPDIYILHQFSSGHNEKPKAAYKV